MAKKIMKKQLPLQNHKKYLLITLGNYTVETLRAKQLHNKIK